MRRGPRGKRYVDDRDIGKNFGGGISLCLPIPRMIYDDDAPGGVYPLPGIYIEGEDWVACEIDPLVAVWKQDMHDEEIFNNAQRLTIERLIEELP